MNLLLLPNAIKTLKALARDVSGSYEHILGAFT